MERSFLPYNLLLFALLFTSLLFADNYVIINQVMYDTPLLEQNLSGSHPYNGEFIELYNAGERSVSLDGWSIKGSGQTEQWTFSGVTLLPQGYLLLACRRGQENNFQLADLYTSLQEKDIMVIYQNKIILVNNGETLALLNAQNDTVDYMYYGKPDNTFQDVLDATNADGLEETQCVSLHRKWVEFDAEGKVVPNISMWTTDFVTFGENILPDDSYYEDNIIGGEPLPNGTNGSTNENFVLTITPLDPTARIDIRDSGLYVSSAIRTYTSIRYMDGLGREEETIAIGVTPDSKDIVNIVDNQGNVSRQWLPIVMQTQGQRVDITDVQAHAIADYGERPFAETKYESASNQIKIYQPGSTYAEHPKIQSNEFNGTNEVRMFTVCVNGDLHSSNTFYNYATLFKTTTADEDGKTIITYTDKQGRKIMDRHGTSEVYYVYDNMGRLRYMLPNISSKLTTKDYPLDDVLLKSDAYCYQYDSAGCLVYKRLPGTEPQLMVYDELGQLVLKQDGNQRANGKWTMCAYDSIGRILYTAEISLTQTHEELIKYFADKWQVEHFGNNNSFPIAGTGYASKLLKNNNIRLLTINYYDDYDYIDILPTSLRQSLKYKQESGYGSKHESAMGLLTGVRVYNLSEDGYTATSYYYDANGCIIQSRSTRSSDEYKIITNIEYLFDGSVSQQQSVQGYDEETFIQEHYHYKYDHAGRALEIKYQLNDDTEMTLSKMSYDNLGRLSQNILHGKDTIRYSYDMRNTLTEILNKHFSEKLYHADNIPEYATACYNGNISSVAITMDGELYDFAYAYDEQNRLLEMNRNHCETQSVKDYLKESYTYDVAGNIMSLSRKYKEHYVDNLDYSYGDSGNQLQAITDNGRDADNFNCIEYHDIKTDDVEMFYDSNGNLIKDADRNIDSIVYNIFNLPDTIKFYNGNKIVNFYDASGRKYKSVTYSVPETQGTAHQEIAEYIYDTDSMDYDCYTTEYLGNIDMHYTKRGEEITTSQVIHNAIGFCKNGIYHHLLKDHLGNVCAVVQSETDEVVQSTLYYASGVPTPLSENRGEQPYLYNGKELVENPSMEYDVYDYGFRGYYTTIGRFTSIDPLAEQTPWQSPYVYANNNFINKIDYMGLFGASPNDSFESDSDWDNFIREDSGSLGDDDFGGGYNFEWGLWYWSVFGEFVNVRDWVTINDLGIETTGLSDEYNAFSVVRLGPQFLNYIVINGRGEKIGGIDDGDDGIYLSQTGTWSKEQGKKGLTHVGRMFGSWANIDYYGMAIGERVPGWYDGQWSISVAGLLGICLDISLVKKVEINLNAVIELWKISFNGEFDFSEIRNGTHNGMLGVGGKFMGYGGYFQESFKVYSGSMEYVPASTTYSGGLLFPRTSGTGGDGNITLSAALSAVLGLSVTFSINIYYQGQ